MSANPAETSLEELKARHRKENKELVAKVTALKKTVSKGDKRKKKEVSAEIAVLEAELSARQASEIKELESLASHQPEATVADDLTKAVAELGLASTDSQKGDTENDAASEGAVGQQGGLYGSGILGQARLPGGGSGKKNKAKLRQQRKAEELRRQQEEAEEEASGMVDLAAVENENLSRLAAENNLCIKDIRADGHCLYSAFADQMNTNHGQNTTYQDMRRLASEHMRSHQDDFIPFFAHDNGDMFSNADYSDYCNRVANSAEWGGHQEITALSHVFKVPVLIYQTDMRPLSIGEEYMDTKEPVRLSYHRHAYGLGEHYNSLRKITS
ncbi:OTU protein [Coemansia sp. Benny D115]|nr:OTU protein [Coemansia sp. Benny D115]